MNSLKDLKTPTHSRGFYLYFFFNKNFLYIYRMKKYTIVFALITITVLSACGKKSTTNEKMDSTSTQVDSTTFDDTAVGASNETSEIQEVE